MREQQLKPKTRPVVLYNYLPESFTFYWDKEPYTLKAGEKMTMFEWLATFGAVKIAERWYDLNPTNPNSTDQKQKGFYSRHDEGFKVKVKEALIYPAVADTSEQSETANAVAAMNAESDEPKSGKKSIELKTADDVDDEPVVGCAVCRATGPRHKPTCPKFVSHKKDEAQAAKLAEAAA